jgi:thymidylate kinase
VECDCPKALAIQRIEQRAETSATESDARPELYDQQRNEYESLESALPAVRVDSTSSIGEELQIVLSALRTRLFTT